MLAVTPEEEVESTVELLALALLPPRRVLRSVRQAWVQTPPTLPPTPCDPASLCPVDDPDPGAISVRLVPALEALLCRKRSSEGRGTCLGRAPR